MNFECKFKSSLAITNYFRSNLSPTPKLSPGDKNCMKTAQGFLEFALMTKSNFWEKSRLHYLTKIRSSVFKYTGDN